MNRRSAKHPKSCHERALGLLAVRPRSRSELERRLLQAGFESGEVAEELVRLEDVGLIDDLAFARQVTDHEFGSRRAGTRAVARALASKGVSSLTVARVMADAPIDEDDRALDLAGSGVGRMAGLDPTKAFSRLTSLLVRRGYDSGTARRAARRALGLDEPPD